MITIGIADDDPMVRTGLALIVGGEPDLSIVWQAGDGREAVRLCAEQPIDVLLLDMRMPVLDGLATLCELQGQSARPAVLVLTTFNTDDYVVRALAAGATGFLLKDANPDQLVAAIRDVHLRRPALSPAVTSTLIDIATRGPRPDATAQAAVASLTERERDVATLMADGLTNGQIASQLHLSPASVKAHLSHLFAKLGVDNRVSAAMLLRDAGV